MTTAADILTLRERGLTFRAAAARLDISPHSLRGLLLKYRLKWTRLCRFGHPANDKVQLGERRRCRLCYLAELEQRKGRYSLSATPRAQVPTTRAQIEAEAELERTLAAVVANETAMPWERVAARAP